MQLLSESWSAVTPLLTRSCVATSGGTTQLLSTVVLSNSNLAVYKFNHIQLNKQISCVSDSFQYTNRQQHFFLFLAFLPHNRGAMIIVSLGFDPRTSRTPIAACVTAWAAFSAFLEPIWVFA